MKKILLFLLMVLAVASGIKADSFGSPTNTVWNSNNNARYITNKGIYGLGIYAGSVSSVCVPFAADVTMNLGDVVVLTTNTTNGVSVSKTTTVGDASQVGIVTFPLGVSTVAGPAGGVTPTVQVAQEGVALAKIAVSVTKGDLLVTSGTAGFLTAAAAATASSYTALSHTPIVGEALETVAVTGGVGYARILVHP